MSRLRMMTNTLYRAHDLARMFGMSTSHVLHMVNIYPDIEPIMEKVGGRYAYYFTPKIVETIAARQGWSIDWSQGANSHQPQTHCKRCEILIFATPEDGGNLYKADVNQAHDGMCPDCAART